MDTTLAITGVWLSMIGFLGMGGYCLYRGVQSWRIGTTSQHWPTIDGQIISAKVVFTRFGLIPTVTYRYSVNNKEYVRTPWARARLDGEAVAQRYTSGEKVRVYYDPRNPKTSVLEPLVPAVYVRFSLLLGLIFLGLGLMVFDRFLAPRSVLPWPAPRTVPNSAGSPARPLLAGSGVLLRDDFSNPNSGWPRWSTATGRMGYIDGEYVIAQAPGSRLTQTAARAERLGDFSVEIEGRLLSMQNDAFFFLAFRENADAHYQVTLWPNTGTYSVSRWRWVDEKWTHTYLLPVTRAPEIHRGAEWNHLGVRAAGSEIVVFLNSQPVARVQDEASGEGTLALGVGDRAAAQVEGRFRHFLVSSPDALAGAPAQGAVAPPPSLEPSTVLAAPGSVLAADDFSDPATGVLPSSSADPTQYVREYLGQEYRLQQVNPTRRSLISAAVRGVYANAALSVQARLVGAARGQYLYVSCRKQAGADSAYRLSVDPAGGRFSLLRRDAGRTRSLTDWQASPAIQQGGATNHLELSGSGSTIAATINEVVVASAEDSTYQDGEWALGVWGDRVAAEARFADLIVSQQ